METMGKKYRGILFDLDGTLLDTSEDLAGAINYVMRKYHFDTKTVEQIKSYAGNGIRKLVARSVPQGEQHSDFEKIFEDFRKYYTGHCRIRTGPYPGIPELLEQLSRAGYSLAIVSNKNHQAVAELNQQFFQEYISIAIGQKEGRRTKPAPDSVYDALEQLGLAPEEALYVGDSDVDKATADHAGLDCVLVGWGFRSQELLKKLHPMKIITQAQELLDFLQVEE